MPDTPKADDALLHSILEMRQFVDDLIDQERRRVGEWIEEFDGDAAAIAESSGPGRGEAMASQSSPRGMRPERADRRDDPDSAAPRPIASTPAANPRASGPDGRGDDPRKRLDALAKRLDGRVGRPPGPSAGGS